MTRIAYYCSGHGYGHATRVSAFASHLCNLPSPPTIHIVSSAPKHVFADSIAQGAHYRFADIDPVIVQPLAYHVDRRKSIEVLRQFIQSKEQKVEQELDWVKETGISCILSDAAFLACLVAHRSRIPCALITNFTFDSVYSYLCSTVSDLPPTPVIHCPHGTITDLSSALSDIPLSPDEVAPLVEHIHSGYRCADLLLLLPGSIPIPSFKALPSLPSYEWVDVQSNSFNPRVLSYLTYGFDPVPLLTPLLFDEEASSKPTKRRREVRKAPLIVRHPSKDIYTPEGRRRLLTSIGVPANLQDTDTKVLIVSFGGQIFRRPHSRNGSRHNSRDFGRDLSSELNRNDGIPILKQNGIADTISGKSTSAVSITINGSTLSTGPGRPLNGLFGSDVENDVNASNRIQVDRSKHRRLTSTSHLFVPGAPPAIKSPIVASGCQFSPVDITIQPPTPMIESDSFISEDNSISLILPRLLPDSSWIAVVCGVSKQWGQEDGEELPEGFFIAPKDVYMPDLTAVADVLLGKLGYGTVSECVDACTPFVYVPRPLFIEEHGLKLLLDQQGVGVELSRQKYEDGDWASSVEQAWVRGRVLKEKKRHVGETGVRKEEGRKMAEGLMEWIQQWNSNE